MRSLSVDLEGIQLNLGRRRAWKLYVYDFNATRGNTTPDTISRLVQGETLDSAVGPLDLTDFVIQVDFTERGSDFANGTIAGNSLSFAVADRGLVYDPYGGSESNWLKQGNGVVFIEGDEDLAEANWVTTFTGTIVGRAAASARDRAGNAILQVAAEDRMAAQLKKTITSQSFDQGTPLNTIMTSILEDDVGMQASEFDIGLSVGTKLTTQASTQIVDESPMVALAKLGFIDGFMPRFRGDGVLEMYPNFSTKGYDVIYANQDLFEQFTRPFSPLEITNEVSVIGLEADMSKIEQPLQQLATASVTLGFFGGDETIPVQWSDDRTQQADNPSLNVLQSVTGALIPFGAESFSFSTDNDGGSRYGEIEIEGAFYAPLVTVLYAAIISTSFIPDAWAGIGGGNTIPIGRLVEGTTALAVSTIQATIGRGQYEIVGTPYEYVFKEIRGVARVGDLPFIDIVGITVENHLVDTQTLADSIALRELRTARKRGNSWSCVMKHDLRLEPGDRFRISDASRDFIVTQVTRSIKRGEEPQTATLQVYETTSGVNP